MYKVTTNIKKSNTVAHNLAGVAFNIWKKYYFSVFDQLVEAGLLNDWRQEAILIALEAEAQGFQYGDKKLPSFIYRAWYDFLVRYGFRRPRNCPCYIKDVCISNFGEDFLAKTRDIQDKNPLPKSTPKEKITLFYNYKGDNFIFTQHFIERWESRVNMKFSPLAVIQQLRLGKTLWTVKSKTGGVSKRIKCPWFNIQLVVKGNKNILITIFK